MDNFSNGLWLKCNNKKICYNPWTHFEVNNPNGDVTMCCDYPEVLGNVNKQSILEIWNGEKYQEVRKKMFELGGEKMCSPDCLLLNGMKNHQSFSWFSDIPITAELYNNAVLNEGEIRSGEVVLKSKPRWMRFAVSYKCNFKCYHCYQKDYRNNNIELGDHFLEDVKKYVSDYQYLFLFGGEPTILPQFKQILNFSKINPFLRLGSVTNATFIDNCYDEIKNLNWAFFDVSLDAASENTFKILRNPYLWNKVISNIHLLTKLAKEKKFIVNISMTLNSVNCHEIYRFVELCFELNAFPQINIVSNPAGLIFQFKYLWFSEKQRVEILNQLTKIDKNFDYEFNEIGLNVVKNYFDKNYLSFKLFQNIKLLKLLFRFLKSFYR